MALGYQDADASDCFDLRQSDKSFLGKHCNRCDTTKPLFDFTGDASRKDGKYPICKPCRRVGQVKYIAKIKASQKTIPNTKKCSCCRQEKNSTEFQLSKAAVDGLYHYCNSCKRQKAQITRYKCTYNFSVAEAKDFAKNNVGSCSICNSYGKLVVDHCHSSGRVRGHICNACNTMLGFAKDSPSTLAAAADYLKRNY